MKSVLIVEDEAYVRAELRERIDWQKFGYGQLIEADNGMKGLECYKRVLPDLVLTDIRMPVMNGIDFCSELMRINRNTKIVVLSSYMDFDYVRQAFKLGVYDYLPKHQMDEQHLSPILKRLEEAEADREPIVDQLGRRVYLRHWLAGTLDVTPKFSPEPYLFAAAYRLLLYKVQIDDYYRVRSSVPLWQEHDMEGRMAAAAMNAFHDCKVDVTDVYEGALFAVVALPHVASRSAFGSFARQHARQVKDTIAEQTGLSVSVSYYPFPVSGGELRDVYHKMHKEGRRIYRRGEIREFANTAGTASISAASRTFAAHDPARIGASFFTKLLQEYCPEQAKQALQTVWLVQAAEMDDQELRACYAEWIGACYAYEQEMGGRTGIEAIVNVPIEHFTTLEGLYEWSVACMAHLKLALTGDKPGKSERSRIGQIEQYIRGHIQEDLSLHLMAERFHFNKTYLSEMFKRETGTTYTHYVTGIRMELARRLLTETDRPIQEISSSVGFNDVAYFIKSFRSFTGQTPASFRKLSGVTR